MLPALTASWHRDPADVPADQWDALVDQAGGSPFLRHAWLAALHRHGCAHPDTGWSPMFLLLRDGTGQAHAGCALYWKAHSWGEYVFDWAWADAYNRQLATDDRGYYPKLVSASPFSPVTGPRLLVHPSWTGIERHALMAEVLTHIEQACASQHASSAHVLFLPQDEADLARQAGWLIRQGVQFHWRNRQPQPYASFDDFLDSLHRDKRKKIRQERRKVRDAGIEFQVLEGDQIQARDWDFFYRCYAQTYHERGQQPYLSRAFWAEVGQTLPASWVMFVAHRTGVSPAGVPRVDHPIACALLAVDRPAGIAYGRYWGALEQVSCLHFEACYYQPLQWCIEQQMACFEGGAQGEHKLARGLLATTTYSVHHLPHAGFRQAVERFVHREGVGIAHYLDELDERGPFKA